MRFALTIRGLTIRGLTIRGLTIRGLTIRGLTIRGLAVWGLTLLAGASCAQGRPPTVTTYPSMTRALKADAAASPFVRIVSLGRSARGRKDIWLARIADPAVPPQDTVRILILCRQHGDEPASTEAALKLLHGLTAGHDPALRRDLKRVVLYLIPMVNPDGADAMTRLNGVGADLNRDWGVFSQPETQAVARAADAIRPQIVIDAHNWDGDDPYNANCVEVIRPETTPLQAAAHAIQQEAAHDLSLSGFQVNLTTYGADLDSRLAHRYFTRRGVLSMLVETHSGDPNDQGDFQRRRAFYLTLIHGLSHRFGQGTAADRLALEHVERAWAGPPQEASLFAPPVLKTPRRLSASGRPQPLWLWALCLYGGVLWIGSACRRPPTTAPQRENAKAGTVFVPSGKRLSAGRHGTPRYRHSPSSPGFRPAPVACARKR